MSLNSEIALFIASQYVCAWLSLTRLIKTDLTQDSLWSWFSLVTLFGLPCPMSPFVMLLVTAPVRGGANDLCLTNGSFIIPSATCMRPVFIALYFKLNHSGAHPSWSPVTFTGGDGLALKKPVWRLWATSASKQNLVSHLSALCSESMKWFLTFIFAIYKSLIFVFV